MQKTKHKQKIYLEDLPKYTDGEFNGCINWAGYLSITEVTNLGAIEVQSNDRN